MRKPKNIKMVRSTSFKKGDGRKRGTRAKGKHNRTTTVLKDAILLAAELVGEDNKGKEGLVGYLKMLAIKERVVYAGLLSKVLPLQLTVAGTGEGPPKYTPQEAVEKLRERGLPVPPALMSMAGGTNSNVVQLPNRYEDYEDELDGKGPMNEHEQDEDEPLDDDENEDA